MQRFTRIQDGRIVADGPDPNDAPVSGPAIDRLYQLENHYFALLERQQAIPAELERLRSEGKTKTVRFRELLAERLMVSASLAQMDAPSNP